MLGIRSIVIFFALFPILATCLQAVGARVPAIHQYVEVDPPHYFHPQHGWWYIEDEPYEDFWVYDFSAQDWFWLAEDVYPYIWSGNLSNWLFYESNSSGNGRYYSYHSRAWFNDHLYQIAEPFEPTFLRTEDSDEWVNHTFKIQETYSRVLLVTRDPDPPQTIMVKSLDLNNEGTAIEKEYDVDMVFNSLQSATYAARGGDLIAVMPGNYWGFRINRVPTAGDGAYIHYKALGEPGEVVIDDYHDGNDRNWMIYLSGTSHVIIEGFRISGSSNPAFPQNASGPRAGIMIGSGFFWSGSITRKIIILNNYSHNHRSWGLHSVNSHSVLIQGNVFANNAVEHGCYVSDGSDNYVVRNNIVVGNRSSGIQFNLDPVSSVNRLMSTATIREEFPEIQYTRDWYEDLFEFAESLYGRHNFPDGAGVNHIIENNILYGNGQGGGGVINLAGFQHSIVQNNLIYGNSTTGIALWNDGNPWDTPYINNYTGSTDINDFPHWGSRNNIIRNNTIVMTVTNSRRALYMVNGSYGNTIVNNVFIKNSGIAVQVSADSMFETDSAHNVTGKRSVPMGLANLSIRMDQPSYSATNVSYLEILGEFEQFSLNPWINFENGWWTLNPNRPDFRPRASSGLLVGKGDYNLMPAWDMEGNLRTAADIGALIPMAEDPSDEE